MKELDKFILLQLADSDKTIWDLLDGWQFTLAEFISTVNKLYEEGLLDTDGKKLRLTREGKGRVNRAELRYMPRLCGACKGRRITLPKPYRGLLRKFRRAVRGRPAPKDDYYQGFVGELDVAARIALMNYHGDVADKKIILIGDDDLLSVALALTGLPSRIVVLDVDERIGDFIDGVNEKHGLTIEFLRYNVEGPLPKTLLNRFDAFSSEPLETESGMKAFLSRGVACLRKGGVGYFGLTTLEASRRKWFMVEESLLRMGCVITDVIRGFTVYPSVYFKEPKEPFLPLLKFKLKFDFKEKFETGWYKSSLVRFEAVEPSPIVRWNEKIKVELVDPKESLAHPFSYGPPKPRDGEGPRRARKLAANIDRARQKPF